MSSGLGGEEFNNLVDDIKSDFKNMRDEIESALSVDKVPPGGVRNDPEQQLQKMEQMRMQGDSRALTPEAWKAYEKLRQQVAERKARQ